MVKTALGLIKPFCLKPKFPCGFEQGEGAYNIAGDKFCRTSKRSINMTFRGKVDDGIYAVLLQQLLDQRLITDITLNKVMA